MFLGLVITVSLLNIVDCLNGTKSGPREDDLGKYHANWC